VAQLNAPLGGSCGGVPVGLSLERPSLPDTELKFFVRFSTLGIRVGGSFRTPNRPAALGIAGSADRHNFQRLAVVAMVVTLSRAAAINAVQSRRGSKYTAQSGRVNLTVRKRPNSQCGRVARAAIDSPARQIATTNRAFVDADICHTFQLASRVL
jgi:hypothetical protein